jgi:hypothetical protein
MHRYSDMGIQWLRALGQPRLGAVAAARLPGESGDDQAGMLAPRAERTIASTSPITKAAASRAEQAHLRVTHPRPAQLPTARNRSAHSCCGTADTIHNVSLPAAAARVADLHACLLDADLGHGR